MFEMTVHPRSFARISHNISQLAAHSAVFYNPFATFYRRYICIFNRLAHPIHT
jgi:hypothetical protein